MQQTDRTDSFKTFRDEKTHVAFNPVFSVLFASRTLAAIVVSTRKCTAHATGGNVELSVAVGSISPKPNSVRIGRTLAVAKPSIAITIATGMKKWRGNSQDGRE